MEQRETIRYYARLGKSASETYKLAKQAYGLKCLSRSKLYAWYRRFRAGRESLENEPRRRRPSAALSPEQVKRAGELLRANPRLTARSLARQLHASVAGVRAAVRDVLQLHRLAAKYVPRFLAAGQREARLALARGIVRAVDKNPGFLKAAVAGGEVWCLHPKVRVLVFFDCAGLIHWQFVDRSLTVDAKFYKRVMAQLARTLRILRPGRVRGTKYLLMDEKVAEDAEQFLEKGARIIRIPGCAPHLAPADFFLFPKLKSAIEEVEGKSRATGNLEGAVAYKLRITTEGEYTRAFEQMYKNCSDCIANNGDDGRSDEEPSDNETNVVAPVQYESDTSGEQSDQEISTDVNTILQNTSQVGSPSKGLMMNTIQRLAAQLQNPFDAPPLPEPETIVADLTNIERSVKVKTEKTSPKRPPDDSAILSPTRIKKEVKNEPLSPPKNSDEDSSEQNNTQSPKSFIRIRRISGDKLSKGGEPGANENDQSTATTEPVNQNTNEDDSGFLKIANVVSLAQTENENQIVTNVRKSIEVSPQKVKGLSLLKKPNSYIIKRVETTPSVITPSGETVKLIPLNLPPTSRAAAKQENFISIKGIAVPLTVASGSTPTTIVNSPNQPFKLVKIASPEQVSVAIKLKSANVYEKMLKDDKLIHMFKCMGRDCCFTTSNEQAFNKHLRMHEDDPSNKAANEPKDYFKCAYCYIDCNNYDDLIFHLKKMHIFCRYCCKYCFYRAFAYSYVEIHQKTYHPMKKLQILVVSEELVQLPPAPNRLDRKQIIKPYVCVHECNKYFFIPEAFVLHLNMHHTNIVRSFKCHVCLVTSGSVDGLIEHYKIHGFFKYHCMYCTHGAATLKEMHNHLSSGHNNQPPHVLERCLPREISKNLTAIDQLRVRDVDALYRQRKIGNDEELTKVAISPLTRSMNQVTNAVSLMTNQPIVTTKIITTKENSTFVPITSLDGNVSNIRIVDARSLNPNTATSLLNIGKNIKVTVKEVPNKGKTNESPTVHTIQDDGNEFVSTNFLDHTNLLTGNKIKNSPKPVENKSIDSDSDIEIIEDYTTQPSANSKEAQQQEESARIKIEDVKQEDDAKSQESQPESVESEATGTEAEGFKSPKAEASAGQTDRFLTLDDVKDTGFTGTELFRCGVDSCQHRADTADDLREHMQQCSPSEEDSALYCVHCGPASKRFAKPSFFIDHLRTHGIKRFGCGMCKARFAVQSQAQSHLRAKHKYVSSKIVPADPTNPSPDGLFVVFPLTTADRLKNKKMKTPEKEKPVVEMEKTTFAPSEVNSLPLQAIYQRAVQCAVCPYSNKVRSNMLRHLQAHLNDQSVPESSPVNPVPCLDKKERMFDKMVNLASSSHENGRMGGGGGGGSVNKEDAKKEDDEGLPKYVPENQRYVCGVPECNYLTVEEAMLRHHLKALHSDEVYFRCPHCPPPTGTDPVQNIALEKMGIHLKMHDSRLYKCSHCIYHHYHRHVVERHLTDKHPENRPFVKVIRELQQDDQQQQQAATMQEPEEQDLPDPDGNTWKCNLCDFKCVYKSAMQQHAASQHDERCQFKCNGCSFKTISKVTFDQHLTKQHANESNIEFTTVYQRIKGLKKPDAVEPPAVQEEPFDTTPLWRRDMPRIRHIRGILLEEEEENETKASKRKSDADGTAKPAKIKSSGKSSSLDECKSPDAKRARASVEDIEKLRTPDGGYGSYGTPHGDHYVCTICNVFKSRYKHDFRDHLYRDLKYTHWLCPYCEYKSVNRNLLMKHITNRHPDEPVEPKEGTPNPQLEEWVATVIKTQAEIMKSNKQSNTANAVEEESEVAAEESEDDLVIDVKEEEENENSDDEKVSSEMLPAPLVCKHCNLSFLKWRGFKRHVQLKHLKRLGFLCPYCDRSTNSEALMLQHVRSKHRDLPEKVVENPNPQAGELNAEFWEREYGLVVPKRPKKRKRRDEDDPRTDLELPCDKCDFTAMNVAGLKSHLRTHETRIKQKCTYCTFMSFNSSEMRQHYDVNHAHLEFKVEEAIVTSSTEQNSNARTAKKAKLEDDKKAIVYYCYYCDMGSISLEAIRSHWRMMHKDDEKSVIFKYREHSEPRVKCAYCAESGTKATLANHILQTHGSDKVVLLVEHDEEGWMCKWCKEEFFTTKEEMDQHQRLFHSHLSMSYKVVRRTFTCRLCNFDTLSMDMMQKHAKSHMNVYRCKYCPATFKSFSAVKIHFKSVHPGEEAETRTITGEDLAKEIETLVKTSADYSDVQLSPVKVTTSSATRTPPTSPRVARKSTTRQSLTPIKPLPEKIKAVARKSTNPLPRYPSGIVFETEQHEVDEEVQEKPNYYSYYGRPASPVDLATLNTTMALAGLKMKVNCAKLAEIFNINIDPTLRLVDFVKERNKKR